MAKRKKKSYNPVQEIGKATAVLVGTQIGATIPYQIAGSSLWELLELRLCVDLLLLLA